MATSNDAQPDGSEPTRHYDQVIGAWAYLLGEDLHYGYFADGTESLAAATDALTDAMLRGAQPGPGDRVLDIGCGTGRAACRIAGEFGSTVLGVSPSSACVAAATTRAQGAGLAGQVSFAIGDGTALAQADASFERVWIMESSHLMDDKPALIREAARVLRPGGRLVLCDLMLGRKLALEEVIRHRDEFLLLRDVFGRARMETLAFYREHLQARGLQVEEARAITAETLPTFARWRDNGRRYRQEVEAEIGATGWRQFQDSCDVLENFWNTGVMGYGIVTAVKGR